MYTSLQVVFDAADPAQLADFWALAMGYVEEPPPPGFATWPDFARSIGLPEDPVGRAGLAGRPRRAPGRACISSACPRQSAKNRVHLDVRVAARPARRRMDQRVEEHVTRLVEAGGTVAWRNDTARGRSVVMRDPEGNEFCVC